MSRCDFTVEVGDTSKDEVGTMLSALKSMQDNVSGTLREVRESATNLASTSEQTSVVTEQTRKNAAQQQSVMAQVATSTNEMSAAVQEVAGNTT